MVRSTDDLPTSIGTFDARRTPVASIFHTAVQAFQFHFQLEPSPLGTHIVCDLFIKMTQAEGEAPDRSVSCCTVFCHYHWHVYVWHGRKGPIWLVVGRRRLLAGERRGRWSRRLRTHAARAQLTIGTVSALTKASFARRSLAHTDLVLRCLARYHLIFYFHTFFDYVAPRSMICTRTACYGVLFDCYGLCFCHACYNPVDNAIRFAQRLWRNKNSVQLFIVMYL